MKVKNFTYLWCCFVLSCMLALPQMSYSQTMACNDNVQISLDVTCEGITLDMLLEDPLNYSFVPNAAGLTYSLEVNGSIVGYAVDFEGEFGADDTGDTETSVTAADDFPAGLPENPVNYSSYVNTTATYKLTNMSTGNSCWGETTIELNTIPKYEGGCAETPGDIAEESKVEYEGTLDDGPDDLELDAAWHQNSSTGCGFNQSMTGGVCNTEVGGWYVDLLEIDLPDNVAADGTKTDCPHALTWTSELKYPIFTPKGEVLWEEANLLVFHVDKLTKAITSVGNEAFMGEMFEDGDKFLIMADAANAIGKYKLTFKADCNVATKAFPKVWCNGHPDCFLSFDDFKKDIANGCYDIEVLDPVETKTGDICKGERVNVKYYGKVTSHGEVSTVLILDQTYDILPLSLFDVNDNGIEHEVGDTLIKFPPSKVFDCDDLTDISPESIEAHTGSGTMAYPFFIDMHDSIKKELIFCGVYHEAEAVDTVQEMVLHDPDPTVPGDEVWILVDVVKKEIKETTVCDTFYVNAANEPVYDGSDSDKICDDEVYIRNADGEAYTALDPVYYIEGKTKTTVAYPLVNSMDCDIQERPEIEVLRDNKVCNLVVSYSDSDPLLACGGGQKVIREWTVIDWCDATSLTKGVQFIEIRDTEKPELLAEIDTAYVSIAPWTCYGTLALPTVMAEDNCTEPTVDFVTVEGTISDGFITELWITASPITATAIISDDCGNSIKEDFIIIVNDKVPPVPVCQDNIVVSLTGDGISDGVAKVYADALDAGSHDAGCGDVDKIYVRRMDGCCGDECGLVLDTIYDKFDEIESIDTLEYGDLWGKYVKFCCEDAGTTQMIAMRVFDKAGNYNTCMIEVTVVDKSAAALNCVDVTIKCTDDLEEAAKATGIAAVCDGAGGEELSREENIDGCGNGTVVITHWIDNDGSGDLTAGDATCEQEITVIGDQAFDPHTIKWPKHYTGEVFTGVNLECEADSTEESGYALVEFEDVPVEMGDVYACSAGEPDDVPVWCSVTCGLVGYSVETETVIASDACKKIIKKWTVIDWCLWEANGASPQDDTNDTDYDSFTAVEDWAQGVCDGCDEDLSDPVYFRYDDVEVDGYYTFDQVIKVVDDTAPTIVADSTYVVNTDGGATSKGDSTLCTGSAPITVTATDACGGADSGAEFLSWVITVSKDDEVVKTATATGASATMGSQEGSPGDTHVIKWVVSDGCGNSSSAETVVTFGDTKAPTPLCISGVTTAFMNPGGTVDIWASDFNIGSFDNCTDVTFSMVASGGHPDSATANYTFSCDDIANFADFDVYVTDANGNYDYCTVGVLVGGDCPGDENTGSGAMIGGHIATEFGDMVDQTTVNVTGSLGAEYPKNMVTGNNGQYAFAANPMNEDYDINAEKNVDHLNGVSTFDLVLMQKHILGITPFDTPYKHIAADINGSESITAIDLVELRKLILGIYSELPNNSSWRFVDASQTFSDISNPFPFSEVIGINNLATNMMDEDFVGVKIGDVNGNAVANGFMKASTRTNGTLALSIEDATLQAGQTVRVPVKSDNFTNISGYQFTLAHQGLVLQGVEAGVLKVNESNVGVHNGQTTMSWSDSEAVTSGQVLFTLVFKSAVATDLSKVLDINSSITAAEAYAGNANDRLDVSLAVGTEVSTIADFDLYQNLPNPFEDETVIGFTLPESAEATLTIYDVAGQTVMILDGNYSKGYNEIVLNRNQVNVAGVLYYELESGDNIATKKMIVIE